MTARIGQTGRCWRSNTVNRADEGLLRLPGPQRRSQRKPSLPAAPGSEVTEFIDRRMPRSSGEPWRASWPQRQDRSRVVRRVRRRSRRSCPVGSQLASLRHRSDGTSRPTCQRVHRGRSPWTRSGPIRATLRTPASTVGVTGWQPCRSRPTMSRHSGRSAMSSLQTNLRHSWRDGEDNQVEVNAVP